MYCRSVDLSKYGKFQCEELFGCQLNMCYEISKEGKLTPFSPVENDQGILESGEAAELSEIMPSIIHTEEQPTNQELFDKNNSQKLSHNDILALRDSGKSVITELIQNSTTFDQKNSFSKVKYIQRKQRKFSRWMRVLPVNSRTLCTHFIDREPHKIMDMRLDTLGQVLNLANVQYGGKYLVMDDTKGMLLGAIIERCSPRDYEQKSQILLVHEEDQYHGHVLQMFNFSKDQMLVLSEIHVRDCLPKVLEATPWVPAHSEPEKLEMYADKIEGRRLNFLQKQEKRLQSRKVFDERNFTSIILAVEPGVYTVESLMETWYPFLQPGGSLVIYSSSKEALNPAFFDALISDKFTDVCFTESFLRPYQTAEGRMHPMMTCNGHGGFILKMIKTIQNQKP